MPKRKYRSESEDESSDSSIDRKLKRFLKSVKKSKSRKSKHRKRRHRSPSSDSSESSSKRSRLSTDSDVEGRDPSPDAPDPLCGSSAASPAPPRPLVHLLGNPPSAESPKAPPLNEELVSRWKPIAQNGLSEVELNDLLQKFPVPDNAPFVKAPALNAEIVATLDKDQNNRDDRIKARQQKVSAALAGAGKALSALLELNDASPLIVEIAESLNGLSHLLLDVLRDESLMRRHFREIPLSDEPTPVIPENCLSDLLSKGAIRRCGDCPDQFISDIFLVPKPDGSSRFILNLKALNRFVPKFHFKLEDFRMAARLITKNCFMASIDLKDAYYSVPIHEDYTKYLRFRFNGELFEFVCLPFGLTSAPYVFTKILKPAASFLRQQGFLSVIYLDDILLFGNSKQSCSENVQATIDLLESLGFCINYEKSQIVPDNIRKFLGFLFDSDNMCLRLPPEKVSQIKRLVTECLIQRRIKIRSFAQLIGFLVSCCPAVLGGWAHTKLIEREKALAVRRCGGNFNKWLVLSSEARQELAWWLGIDRVAENPIRSMTFSLEIFSDASLSGWGASCGDSSTGGRWMPDEKNHHINFLEILAAFLGLKCFASGLSDCQILLRIDNTTAISYINRMGGTRSRLLNRVTQDLWKWCFDRKIWVFASYISSSDNHRADLESRRSNDSANIGLSWSSFRHISSLFGIPQIDLFASRENAKCSRYVSWAPDPDSVAVDAFSLNWTQSFFYAFPPPALIPRVLQKVSQEQACGIIVVPEWTAQAWYPMFLKLLDSDPVRMSAKDVLIFFDREQKEFWKKITLVAGRLSGKLSL